MAAIPLFWNTNMVVVTSRENSPQVSFAKELQARERRTTLYEPDFTDGLYKTYWNVFFVCFEDVSRPCYPNPCYHGTCSEGPDGSFDCECHPGYCGPQCKGAIKCSCSVSES